MDNLHRSLRNGIDPVRRPDRRSPNWVLNIYETYRDFHSSENLFVQFPLDVTVSSTHTTTSTEIILVSFPCKYRLYAKKGFFDRTNICVHLKALINKA